MKERSILFSAPMVRAIIEGRKTQTRRIAKERDVIVVHPNGQVLARGGWLPELCCPYGVPGDRIWVRETWAPGCDENAARQLGRPNCYYRATDGEPPSHMLPFKWRPSIYMPRWASRSTLEIEAVRVERIIEISEEDAMAEGVVYRDTCWYATDDPNALPWMTASGAYRELWESINGFGAWDANPWVWVIQFRRITP